MSLPEPSAHAIAMQLGELLQNKAWQLTVAESCTGGSLCAAITDIPGSSRWFDRGFITYSNAAKIACLGVQANVIDQHGAVSQATAIAMAEGALKKNPAAHISVAITGIAGPDGGTEDKPVGTVWIACSRLNKTSVSTKHHFIGNRPAIRLQAVVAALHLLIEYCR